MNEPKIPVFLAVGLWSASALVVLGFTYVAFRETASGAIENFAVAGGVIPAEVAAGRILSAELTPKGNPNAGAPVGVQGPIKPLTRNKFTPSR